MLSESKITDIYCMADDFCKFFDETVKKHSFLVSDRKSHRNKPNRLSNAKVITILVAFHMGGTAPSTTSSLMPSPLSPPIASSLKNPQYQSNIIPITN